MTKPSEYVSTHSLEEIKQELDSKRFPVDVAVHSLDNWFNFGAVVRICHNFQVNSIIGVDLGSYYRKADLGTRKFESIIKLSMSDFLETYANRSIVAFESRPELETENLFDFVFPDNPILFFGSEKSGVPDQILKNAKNVVSIPMYGVHNDHNIAVACGIALYDWTKKYREK
jgi:tRNA (guanosine-2'-O-)-methyltransferase